MCCYRDVLIPLSLSLCSAILCYRDVLIPLSLYSAIMGCSGTPVTADCGSDCYRDVQIPLSLLIVIHFVIGMF